jgi:hypothetical protein
MNKKIFIFLFLFFSASCFSQMGRYDLPDIKWISGKELDFLDGVKKMKVIISYDSLKILNVENEKYQQNVADTYEKDVAGKGKLHMDKWHKAKGDLFQRIFIKNAEPRLAKMKIKASLKMENADCIMMVYPLNTTIGEPGFLVTTEQAYCDYRVYFLDARNNEKVVGEVLALQCSGRSTDWDMSFIGRFKNCFTMCGYYLTDDMVLKMREKKKY